MHTSIVCTVWGVGMDVVSYHFLGSLSPHLNAERGVEGGRGGEGGAQKRTKQRIRDTPLSLSLPPSHKPSGDWINVSPSILVSEGRLSVMPFPNEDNYFQEFESGPIIAGRQAGKQAGQVLFRYRAPPLQPRTTKKG